MELKTLLLTFPQMDSTTGAQALDPKLQPMTRIAALQFCYVRPGRGGESIYADRGMGRGGTGGCVAAALREGGVTETEILDAWQAGDAAYRDFIEHCAAHICPARGIRLSDHGE